MPLQSHAMKRPDPALLLTLLLCSFALIPLVRQAGLPAGYDVLYHTYRVAEMQRSWAAGIYLPHWAESFYFGYGYPVFHYYASFTYYLTSFLIGLTGISALNALRSVIILSFWGAGAGMYLFTSRRWGREGGITAALVYVYSPYILYTEPYARGDYPELLSFGLFPLILWQFDRLACSPQRRLNTLLAALGVYSLIMTHNLMALVFFGILMGWLVWLRLTRGVASWKTWFTLLGAAGVGVGLAAHFWLPVILERDAVQLDNLVNIAELDYRNFFVPLRTLLSQPPRADAGAINGLIPRYHLGVASWVLGLLGAAGMVFNSLRQQASPQARQTAYFALLAAVTIFLITPSADRIWEMITPLAYLQFPWRFLGPSALCLAVLAGSSLGWIETLAARWRMPLLAVIWLLPLILAIPTFYVPQWDLKEVDTSVAAYQAAEVQGLQRGTTFTGEFLPKDVFVVPEPNPRLLADYADGRPIDKIHREVLPDGVEVEVVEQNPEHNTWRVRAAAPFQMEVLTFYFAGWRAKVNGGEAKITPAVPHGFITLPVPAGESIVEVSLENTPPRTAGRLISLGSLLALGGLAYFSSRRPPDTEPVSLERGRLSSRQLWGVGAGILLIFVPLLAALMQPNRAWLASKAGEAQAADHQIDYFLGDQIRLIGYDISDQTLGAGDRLEISLYWYAPITPQAGYASFVHVSTGGPPVAQSDKLNPGGIPTLEWTAEGYIYDPHVIDLPEWLPKGEYRIYVGLWTCDGIPDGQPCGNGLRPPVRDSQGQVIGDSVPLTMIKIK